jgi:hypothetical protein
MERGSFPLCDLRRVQLAGSRNHEGNNHGRPDFYSEQFLESPFFNWETYRCAIAK